MIDENLTLYKESICIRCSQEFCKDEILVMVSLIKKYGGFFNKLNSHKKSIEQIVEKLLINLKKEKDLSKMIEINEIAMHFALLYGYSPKIFIEELK